MFVKIIDANNALLHNLYYATSTDFFSGLQYVYVSHTNATFFMMYTFREEIVPKYNTNF